MGIPFVKSSEDLEKYIVHNKYLVVNFTATWCGPCQAIKPFLDELYGKYDKIEIVKVDLDTQKRAAEKYYISSIPTLIFLEKGEERKRVQGAGEDLFKELDIFAKKASEDPESGRHGNGESANAIMDDPSYKELTKFIPKGFEILNDTIHYGEFIALNSMPLYKDDEDASVKNAFKLDVKKPSTVYSDADSQLLFFVPFINISKICSILIKFKPGAKIASENASGSLDLDEDEIASETQIPDILKVWPNKPTVLEFSDAAEDPAAPHIQKIKNTDDWYECKLLYVRFQNVQNLNIFIDGADSDLHTLIDKIVIVGIPGNSRDNNTIQKHSDSD